MCSRFGRLDIGKMYILPQLIFRICPVSVKIPANFLHISKHIRIFIWKVKSGRIFRTIVEKNRCWKHYLIWGLTTYLQQSRQCGVEKVQTH